MQHEHGVRTVRWSHCGTVAMAAQLAVAGGITGQERMKPSEGPEIAERCRAAEYRHFDFWLGDWTVRNPEGEIVGRNSIRDASRGCGLLEDWTGAGGGRGMSINAYDPDRGVWTQRWVGDGATLWLEGGLVDGRMVLAGTTPRGTPRGPVRDRITWTPLPDGRVRQLWEVSPVGEERWTRLFEGIYEPAGKRGNARGGKGQPS